MNKNVFNDQIILKMTINHQMPCNAINANCNIIPLHSTFHKQNFCII